MSTAADDAALAIPPSWRARLGAIGWSLLCGFVMWLGEALIGVVPLGAHELVARFTASAERPSGKDLLPEMCILAVVVAGLNVVSVLRFGPHERRHRMTPVTFVMMIVSLAALMSGATMYGLAAMDLAQGQTDLAYKAWAAALGSSFVMAMERAIIDA
jgi:hypothetical protein